MTEGVAIVRQPHIKQDDLQHPALEQLPGLSYCINDNPDNRELPCHPMPSYATLPAFHFFFRLLISNPSSLMMITFSPSETIAVRCNPSSSRISIELHFHVSTLFANSIKQCYLTQEIEVVGGISLFQLSHHFLWGVQWFKSNHLHP